MNETCECGEPAVWFYMPGVDDRASCDRCVPRGCSCNEIYLEEFPEEEASYKENNMKYVIRERLGEDEVLYRVLVSLDDEGRELPCCEWMQ